MDSTENNPKKSPKHIVLLLLLVFLIGAIITAFFVKEEFFFSDNYNGVAIVFSSDVVSTSITANRSRLEDLVQHLGVSDNTEFTVFDSAGFPSKTQASRINIIFVPNRSQSGKGAQAVSAEDLRIINEFYTSKSNQGTLELKIYVNEDYYSTLDERIKEEKLSTITALYFHYIVNYPVTGKFEEFESGGDTIYNFTTNGEPILKIE